MGMNDDNMHEFDQLSLLAESGRFEEALAKHIRFHEASRQMLGMGGVRLSYALDLWKELAEKYPPAMDALMELRNKNRKAVLGGNGGFESFHDLSAINVVLDEQEDTLDVFLTIDEASPGQSKDFYPVVEDLLVERQKYDVCARYIGDPLEKYLRIQHLHEINTKLMKNASEMNDDDFKEYTAERFIKSVNGLIEILVAVGQRDLATEVQQRALSYSNDDVVGIEGRVLRVSIEE